MNVPVVENVLKLNDEIASMNRETIHRHSVTAIDIIGAPGCGKTALIEATLQKLPKTRVGVIVGDLATQRDADRMARFTDHVVQINTGKGCHLEANHVRQALKSIDLSKIDLLFIENVGNLICPVGFDLGQDCKVGVFNIAGGDDKAAKHPYIVTAAEVLVLNQIDLLPYLNFNLDLFRSDIKKLNPTVNLLELSAKTGQGFDAWINWLQSKIAARHA